MAAKSGFDPSGVGNSSSLFGFPYSSSEAWLVVLPVPWDVTVSYGVGTSNAPATIREASSQLDFMLPGLRNPWKLPVVMETIPEEVLQKSVELRKPVSNYLDQLEKGQTTTNSNQLVNQINEASEWLNDLVFEQAKTLLNDGKQVAVVGGDHSVPYGLYRALGTKYDQFAILQIDAHMDLRNSYEGFRFSHASIMYEAVQLPAVSRLVQIGIRDFSPEEAAHVADRQEKIFTYFDQDLQEKILSGSNWMEQVEAILEDLPEHVHISLDVDGLEPSLCPTTGTPVPGGLTYNQVLLLVRQLVNSGRTIIGFDLCEVGPGSPGRVNTDALVGARLLYYLCSWMGASHGEIRLD